MYRIEEEKDLTKEISAHVPLKLQRAQSIPGSWSNETASERIEMWVAEGEQSTSVVTDKDMILDTIR